METNATPMCALLVGLPDVTVLAVDDQPAHLIRVHVEQRVERPRCGECGAVAWVKHRPGVELVDLPCFGRSARLVWHKHRWCCPAPTCPAGSWTGQDPAVAAARLAMTDRAGRWATAQVGRHGRTVNEVAGELGCDWHTVNDAVMAYGTPLVEDPDRIGQVTAVGLDEVLFARQGPWRTQAWSTSIADVATGQLLDTRPELRDSFHKLVDQSPDMERSKLEHDLAERRAEIRLLKERIAALTATVEHLIRDNNALRQSLAQPGSPIADLNQRQRSKAR